MDNQQTLFNDPVEGINTNDGLSLAYGVFGSAIKFKMHTERWSGQSEYIKCLRHLCHLPTIGKIYLLSPSDFARVPHWQRQHVDPSHKIINCVTQYPIKKYILPEGGWSSEDEELDAKFEHIKQLTTKLLEDNVTFDFGLFFWSQGINCPSGIPGFLRTILPPHTRAKTLDMTMHYASPLIDFVNRTQVPWFLLATDPRYIKQRQRPRDFTNTCKEIIGQFNEEINWECARTYDQGTDFVSHNIVKHSYCGIEKINLIGETLTPYDAIKDIRFTIVSAQVDGPSLKAKNDFRFQQLKKWILNKDADGSAVIYGRWKENRTQGWPQFKGFIDTITLDNIFKRTKYSLVLPTKRGWATSKPWELLQLGVIPFFHKDFDIQYNMVPKDHTFRCDTPNEFYEKMDYFDAHDQERMECVKQCQEEFLSDAVSGEFLTRVINNQLLKHGLNFKV
tara:strand:+ start:4898 stop:6241 length:1344 start_codon:yes stop_codon:yes gene_type:complete